MSGSGSALASGAAGTVARMRVLAIDGGGIRGIIPALVLADLEQRTGRARGDPAGGSDQRRLRLLVV